MHSSAIKLAVDQVLDILDCEDPFLVDHRTVDKCNSLLAFLATQAAKSPTFACAIWHYLLDHGYQIGNCAEHDAFEKKFHGTLTSITPEKRIVLRRISDKLFVKQNQIQA